MSQTNRKPRRTHVPVVQENRAKHAPLAIIAILQHQLAHDLSTPWAIDISPGDSSVRIRLMGREHAAWMATLVVVEENNEETPEPGFLRTSWRVRLPDTGVEFDIVTYREQPMVALTVVSS